MGKREVRVQKRMMSDVNNRVAMLKMSLQDGHDWIYRVGVN
jgi:hypothetical protein